MARYKNKKLLQEKVIEQKANTMTLEEIEQEEIKLAQSTNEQNFFFNAKRMEMFDKIASLKIKRMELELKQKQAGQIENNEEIKAIEVEFVSPNNLDQNDRLEKLTKEVEDALGGNSNNA